LGSLAESNRRARLLHDLESAKLPIPAIRYCFLPECDRAKLGHTTRITGLDATDADDLTKAEIEDDAK